jgi:hypothetical protein
MTKVKMLETAKGADDGLHIKEYLEGVVYDVSDGLAQAFVGGKHAELYVEPELVPETVPKPKQKSKKGAPENKALGKAPEDKAK